MVTVDLMLGSDIGLWVLDKVDQGMVKNVITKSVEIAHHAERLGFHTYLGNVNFFQYDRAEVGYSVHYPVIIKNHVISSYQKIYNLHPSFLPHGKGFFPVFWAIWEQTAAGASIHEITEKVDEGPVVMQKEVKIQEWDTGGTLHSRVTETEKELFLEHIETLKRGEFIEPIMQKGEGSYHSRKEFFHLKNETDINSLNKEDLLRLIRAFSYDGFSGLEVDISGKKYHITFSKSE